MTIGSNVKKNYTNLLPNFLKYEYSQGINTSNKYLERGYIQGDIKLGMDAAVAGTADEIIQEQRGLSMTEIGFNL